MQTTPTRVSATPEWKALTDHFAALRDVHLHSLTSLEGAIGSLEIDAGLPPSVVLGLLATPACAQSLPSAVRTGLTSKPRAEIFPGRVDLLPPRGRGAEVRLHPYVAGSGVHFSIASIELDGAPAPAADVRDAQHATSCSRQLSDLPFGIGLVSAQARKGVLALGFSGHGASFSAIG